MALQNFAGQVTPTLPSYLQPSQGKGLYAGNYLNFLDANHAQWAQQFLPDVYDKEVEIYGNRTISGFLKMVSAEMPSTSDQIIWLEQGRLHTRYSNVTLSIIDNPSATQATSDAATGFVALAASDSMIPAGAAYRGVIAAQALPNGSQTRTTENNAAGTTTQPAAGTGVTACNFRVGQTVMVQVSSDAGADTVKGIVTNVNGSAFKFVAYNAGSTGSTFTAGSATALVYGSEFAKGTGNFTEKLDPSYSTYSNAPIIMKEHYSINGSDTGQIGWIEVTSENGASGYLWYVKAEHENRLRWEDYLEMSMVEGRTNEDTSAQNILFDHKADFAGNVANAQARGTEGFFQALEDRGNVYSDLSGELVLSDRRAAGSNPFSRTTTANGLHAFDEILRQLDKQGSIEENMLYTDRDLALAFDDMLSQQADAASGLGTSWGIFNNSKDMALNLGFSGFRRGSYDFYKTDWKYLNDYSTRGGFDDIEGVLIPAGTSTVYDQNLGKNIKRPFLHVRYRASETDNRKMKSWITGSVGGAYTTDVDEMRMHYLTERCLITQGANNFFLLSNS